MKAGLRRAKTLARKEKEARPAEVTVEATAEGTAVTTCLPVIPARATVTVIFAGNIGTVVATTMVVVTTYLPVILARATVMVVIASDIGTVVANTMAVATAVATVVVTVMVTTTIETIVHLKGKIGKRSPVPPPTRVMFLVTVC